jgi:hypothetical protein
MYINTFLCTELKSIYTVILTAIELIVLAWIRIGNSHHVCELGETLLHVI